jgi:hypothetical protein
MNEFSLQPLGPNRNVVHIGDSAVLFSYSTPVAAFIPGKGFVATDRNYSTTTSRHVNQWTLASVKRIPDADFRALLGELGVYKG